MKKLSLLFVMLLAYGTSMMAQNVPVPGDIMEDMLDWIDRQPTAWPDGTYTYSSELDVMIWNQDLFGNYVANDYPGWSAESAALQAGETLEYTILDYTKLSFSVYTDWDELFVFQPEEYEEFTEPTVNVPMTIFDGPDGDQSSTYPHFAWGDIHFASQTNLVDDIPGKERFFDWRIGIQMHYTEGDVTTSSNIVYLEVYPKPVTLLGDVNMDGYLTIADVTTLISYVLGGHPNPFNKYNADMNDDNIHNIGDVTMLISAVLKGSSNS